MNKYFVEIPYSCIEYGKIYGYIFAENETQVKQLAESSLDNIDGIEENSDDHEDYNYSYGSIDIELTQENVNINDVPGYLRNPAELLSDPKKTRMIPDYYLNEIKLI